MTKEQVDRLMVLSKDLILQVEVAAVCGWIARVGVSCWLGLILSVFSLTGHAQTEHNARGVTLKDDQGRVVGHYKESHALLIGVSHYTAGWSQLENVPFKLDRFAALLQRHGFNVAKYLNPTGYQLKQAFEDFIGRHGDDPENRLLFYFSGHGYTRGRGAKGYLVPADAPHPLRDDLGFLRTALSMPQILAWSRRLEAKHALFVFDSCFSGIVFRDKLLSDRTLQISRTTAEPARQYIAACRAGEQVSQNSAFTQALVDVLQYGLGDLNADGYVTGRELGLYLRSEVPKHEAPTPQYGESMDYKLSRGDFVFVAPSSFSSNTKPQSRLWVKTHPPRARIRLLNVKREYNPGVALAPQRYHVEVSSPGFLMQKRWISLAEGEDKYITIQLRPRNAEATQSQ